MIYNISKQGKEYKRGLAVIKTNTAKIYYVYGELYKLTGSRPKPITLDELKRLLN